MYIFQYVSDNHDQQASHFHTKIKISHKKVRNTGLEDHQIFYPYK